MSDADMNRYLLALGRITQSYRNLDNKIFGVFTKILDLDAARALVLMGGSDPKRVADKISHYLDEMIRDRSTEHAGKWATLKNEIERLIGLRNTVVHSLEIWDAWPDKITYLRFSAQRPQFDKSGSFRHHKGFAEMTISDIEKASADMDALSDQLSSFLKQWH